VNTATETMRAARLHEFGNPLKVERVPIPELGERDVLVRVKAVSLNGGDPHLMKADLRITRDKNDQTPIRRLPVIIGHHVAGIVEEAGPEAARHIKIGQHVVVSSTIRCGFCAGCRKNFRCENGGARGFTLRARSDYGRWLAEEKYGDGGAAEFMRVSDADVYPIADSVPLDVASKANALGLAYRACVEGKVAPGKTVIVNGASGGGGVPGLMFAKMFGASKIVAIARNRERLLNSARLFDPEGKLIQCVTIDEDIRGKVMDLTNGRGADVLLDWSPSTNIHSLQQCIYSMAYRGRAVLMGGCTLEINISYRSILLNELRILGALKAPSDPATVMQMVADGVLNVSHLVTHRYPLEEINEAMDVLETGRGNPIWIVIEP
jgi:alcohol dehydrogenase